MQRTQHMFGHEFLASAKGIEQGADHGFFYFGPAEILAGIRKGRSIETFRVAPMTFQMNFEDFRPLFPPGQIDKKYFVQSAFTQEFRRQL